MLTSPDGAPATTAGVGPEAMRSAGSASRALNIVHVIPTMASGGGAEAVLDDLIAANPGNRHAVVTLLHSGGPGGRGERLAARGIEIDTLGLRGVADLPRALWRLHRTLRRLRPDVVQTWMSHADLLGGVVARLTRGPIVVWSLHHSTHDRQGSSWSSRASVRLCALVSRSVPRRIASCSEAGVAPHVAAGYDAGRVRVVHNGYDARRFAPRPEGTRGTGEDRLRTELGLPAGVRLLGMAARWDPQKDHGTLLRALASLDARAGGGNADPGSDSELGSDDWICVLFGRDVDPANETLQAMIRHHGLERRVVTLGIRSDVVEVMRSLDLGVLSSRFGEAFPNVLNESMLVGVPCVTTDVGDAALIVGDTGWVVPPAAPEALAGALSEALVAMRDDGRWAARRRACRARIEARFGVERMAAGYDALWREALDEARGRESD